MIPHADAVYGADWAWWKTQRGLPDFRGLKVTQDRRTAEKRDWNVRKVLCHSGCNELMFGTPGVIGWAGNSGFQAINLAIQWGVRRIALCGFDCSMVRGTHWHGRHEPGLNNPSESALEKWRVALDAQAGILRAMGVEVIIATPDSRLQNYPRRALMELFDDLRQHGNLAPEPAPAV